MALMPWRELADALTGLVGPMAGRREISVISAAGRILARDVAALRPLPPASHAVMDGFALGSVPPGAYRLLDDFPERLGLGDAIAVAAGDPVPLGAAAVVLADKARRDGDGIRVTMTQAKDNIRRAGEEAAAGDVLLSAGQRLDARHLAFAAAGGVRTLSVAAQPRIALLVLDDGPDASPHLGVAQALLSSAALRLTTVATVRGGRLADELERAIRSADLVVCVSASLGDEDGPLARSIAKAGGAARIHRAAMKPAKPVVSGRIGGTAIIGLSGTAYAVTIAAHLFLRPMLRRLAGLPADTPLRPAKLDFARSREPGRAEALPVHADASAGCIRLSSAGRFGQLSALAAMDGFALIEADALTLEPGAACVYHPLLMPLV
ncbi:MAG: hypothetical protein ACRCTI_13215 [Beijerinckiaceae bacterium]